MNLIKFLTVVVIIIAFATCGESRRREKRTLGTILQFFGYRLVPIMDNMEQPNIAMSSAMSEKLRSSSMNENQRIPIINRIQTVMPFFEFFQTTTQASARVNEMTTATREASIATTSNEPTTEATTVKVSSALLRIIMEEISSDPTEATTALPSTTSVPPSSTTEKTTSNMERLPIGNSSERSARLEESTPLPNIASLPLDSSNTPKFERQMLDPPPVRSFVRVDAEANQRRINAINSETNQINSNSLASDQIAEQNRKNVEILKSDDVSNSFFDQPTFPVYESFPPYIQAQPFSLAHEQSYFPQDSLEHSDFTPSTDTLTTDGEYIDFRTYYE